MSCNKGYSLLSFLLYLTLFSIIAFFISQVITSLVIPSQISLRKTQSLIALHIVSDFFVRDIKTITNNQYVWKVILPHEIIWCKKHSDGNSDSNIGWRFSNTRLERKEGLYDGAWKHAKTSVIAKGLMNVAFSPERDGNHIIGIELTMTSQLAPEKPVVCYVCSKTGEIYETK